MTAKRHYVKVEGGDSLLIDLGGYGIEVILALKKTHYDVKYVLVDYKGNRVKAHLLPADMILFKGGRARAQVDQADKVRIWRHQKQ